MLSIHLQPYNYEFQSIMQDFFLSRHIKNVQITLWRDIRNRQYSISSCFPGNYVLLVFTIQNRLQEMQKDASTRWMLANVQTLGPVPTHATSPAGCSLPHVILSRIWTKAFWNLATNYGHFLIQSKFHNCWTTPCTRFRVWMLSSSENQIQSDSSQYWKVWTPEVCSWFWKHKPLKAKCCFKDTAIVSKAAYFCIKPLEDIDKCGGWTLHPYSFSVVRANSPSVTSQCWWLRTEGTAGQSGIGLHGEPEVALAETRENKRCYWVLPRTQNPTTICPYSPEDVEGPVVSAFTIKHDSDMIMVLMLLYLQCMMVPGSVRACLLFMRVFVFAIIGEQGVLEALFSCDLVNFLRIFL